MSFFHKKTEEPKRAQIVAKGLVLGELVKGNCFREVKDHIAQQEIEDFILRMREENVSRISVFDVVSNLRLPPEQVEKILCAFERQGRISEING